LIPPNRGQPPQRHQKHRPQHRGGKHRSRRNAIWHGLCAKTVIENVEDIEDYNTKRSKQPSSPDRDAQTAVEREWVLRLASLLSHLRRATAIETDLLRIRAEMLRHRLDQTRSQTQTESPRPCPFVTRSAPSGAFP